MHFWGIILIYGPRWCSGALLATDSWSQGTLIGVLLLTKFNHSLCPAQSHLA